MHNSPPSTFSVIKEGQASDSCSGSFLELTLWLPFALPDGSHSTLPRKGKTGGKERLRNVEHFDSFSSTAATSVRR